MKQPKYRYLIAALGLLCGPIGVASDTLPPDVGIVEMGAGRLFVDKQGYTLYTYKADAAQPGTSACVEDCALTWPPVMAARDATTVGDWSVITRPDGSRQWAYQSKPVYRFTRDTHPGAVSGVQASGFWDVLFEPVRTPPGIRIHATPDGQTLMDQDGRTAYTPDSGRCIGSCLNSWRPLEAPWLAGPIGPEWEIFERDDGSAQWAYKNQPLFVAEPTNAVGASPGWQLVVLQPAPLLPDWVTVQETDFGPVLADENRMTLYSMASDPKEIALRTCNAECEKQHWNPVIAPPGTQPIGNWSTRQLDDGTLQWLYLGRRVFTYRHDKLPGDINGDKFATGANIRAGWRAILKDTLAQKLF